jgi:hypothetical protein
LSNSLNFYLPKNNRCYENYVYLSNISIRSFVLLAYPLLFLNLCIFCKKSCYVIIMLLFFFLCTIVFGCMRIKDIYKWRWSVRQRRVHVLLTNRVEKKHTCRQKDHIFITYIYTGCIVDRYIGVKIFLFIDKLWT